MWLSLGLLSAGFVSVRRIAEKPLTGKIPFFTLGFLSQFVSLPILAFIFLLSPKVYPLISDQYKFWLPLIVIWLILWPIQTYCYFRALHEGTLSEVIPILSLSPIFIVGISAVLTSEFPSKLGIIGIIFTVLGVFILNSTSFRSFTHLKNNIPVILMIISSISTAIGSTLDKIALSVSHPQWYSLVNFTGAAIVLFVIATRHKRTSLSTLWTHKQALITVGIVQSLMFSSYIMALQTGITSYVVALRNLNVVFSAILGIVLFHEVLTRKKIIAFVSISIGIILLGFFG